jgi:hypothetical protein
VLLRAAHRSPSWHIKACLIGASATHGNGVTRTQSGHRVLPAHQMPLQAWNAYPYTVTKYEIPMVDKFSLEIITYVPIHFSCSTSEGNQRTRLGSRHGVPFIVLRALPGITRTTMGTPTPTYSTSRWIAMLHALYCVMICLGERALCLTLSLLSTSSPIVHTYFEC